MTVLNPDTSLFSIFSDSYTWYHLIGYGYAVFLPALALQRFGLRMWELVLIDAGAPKSATDSVHRSDLPLLIGMLERTLYVASWLAGHPEFLGVWLALKIAGGWKAWSDGWKLPQEGTPTVTILGRTIFNTHLLGSGLSLLNALVGAYIVIWLLEDKIAIAFWVGLLNLVVTYALWMWAHRSVMKREQT